MKLKQTVKIVIASLAVVATVVFTSPVSNVNAECGGVKTSIINCTQTGAQGDLKDSGIWGVLLLVINILTAGIGIAAIGGIVYGSILYTTSGGEPERIKKAITVIRDVVIGIAAYALMYALLNFLVPGGLFN